MTDTTLPDYASLAPKVLGSAPAAPAPVAAPAPDVVPDYKAIVQSRAADAVRNTMQFAPAANPDEEAKFRHLSKFIGAPLDTVRADPAAAGARASLLATDADRLAASNAATANLLSDPSNARMLHDQIPNVAATETAVQALAAQPQRSVWADVPSALASTGDKIHAAGIRAQLAVQGMLPKWLQSTPDQLAENMETGGQVSDAAAAEAPQTLPGQVVGGLAYAGAGPFAPAVVAGAEGTAREQELLGKGVDPDAARLDAAQYGGMQGLIQLVPLGRTVFGQGGKALLKSAVATTARAAVVGGAQSAVSDAASQQILEGVGTDQKTVDEYAPSWQKVVANAAFMGALHLGTQVVTEGGVGIGKAPDTVGATDAAQATQTQSILQKLGELATSGKFRERDPQAFNQFVNDVVEQTGAPDLYVDARQLAQALDKGNVTGEQLAAQLPDVAAQMREALQSEGTVKIALADYATHIAGGPLDAALLPHLKTDPAGMTYTEAQAFHQDQVGQLTPEAQALAATDAETASTHATELQGVHDTVLDQLNATGRYKPEVSKAYAAITRDFYGTTADRLGVSPAELFAKHPLNIAAEDVAGEHLDQPAFHGTPHTVDRFTTQKIGTGEGNQSYGWGMYFAGNRDVAEFYRDSLARDHFMVDSKPLDETNPAHVAAATLEYNGGDRLETADHLRAEATTSYSDAAQKKVWRDAAKVLESGAELPKVSRTDGNLYKVEVPEDERLLDSDAKLKDQPEHVQAALEKLGIPREKVVIRNSSKDVFMQFDSMEEARRAMKANNLDGKPTRVPNNITGAEAYQQVARHLGASIVEDGKLEKPNSHGGVDSLARLLVARDGFKAARERAQDLDESGDQEGLTAAVDKLKDANLRYVSAPEAASLALDAAGVPGLRYRDQGSRGTQGKVELTIDGKKITPSLSTPPGESDGNVRLLRNDGDIAAALAEAKDSGSPEEVAYLESLGDKAVKVTRDQSTHNYVVFHDNHVGAPERLNGENDGSASSTDTGSLRQSGGVRGSDGILAKPSGSDQGHGGARESDGSLVGLPRKVGKFTASAFPHAQRVAADYMARVGLPYDPPSHYVKVDPARATRIADAFEAMVHNPQDPAVKASYAKMIDETAAQYQAVLDAGLKVEFVKGDDPYAGNPRAMTDDVRDNNHMWVFSTRDGFGTDASFDPTDNPLLAETAFEIDGKPALANDLFRVVHDYFGHVKEGVGFRADGEENAWRAHMAMYSPEARGAATTETRGQNSWLNFGPHGETNRTAKVEDTHFADQKIGLLPDWAVNDGRTDATLDQGARGTYSPESNTITALHDADLSTYLHELGHHFLETYARLAAEPGAPEGVVNDFRTLMAQHGSAESASDWLAHSLDERRDVHENFARGFEAYLMEGKAPTPELQSLFGKFRSWLLQVYKSLSALRVQLTPEVRGVMDRMLATDTEIRQAEAVRSMEALFKAKPEGMSDADYEAYQGLGQQATEDAVENLQRRSLRDMQWLSNAKSKALKGLQKQAEAERSTIRDEVTKEFDENPATQAKTELATAEKEHDQHPTSADFNAQLIAEQHGFETVEAMHRSIDELGDRKAYIEGRTDQRMLEEHGDLVDPRSIERAAEAAVHNEARTRFLATELTALAKATGSPRLLAKAAQAAADAAIAGKRVRDLRPDQYSAAEARAGRAADKAFQAGDTQTAAVQKRAQLLSNTLARSATDAAGEIVKAVEYLKKFDKESVRDKVDVAYRDQIDALLAAHDLRTSVSGKALDKRVSLKDFIEREQAAGREPMIPQDLVDDANLTHYKDMTVESFRGLVDAVKSLDHLGRLKTKILDGRDARDFKAVVDDAVASMGALPQRDPETNRGLSAVNAKWLSVKAAGRSLDSSLIKMEQVIDWLDNHEANGVMNRVVFKRIADAGTRENDMRTDMVGKLKELAAAQPKGYGNDFDKKLTLPGLIDTKTGKTQILLKRELLSAALNRGNESNWQKLLTGEKGWSERALLRAFDDHLTKADWDYVQGVWHAIDSLWPEINAMERRLGNTSPEKIAPRAFDTKHGSYEGGYYPAVYDPLRSFDVEQNRQRSGDSLFENNYQKATTSKGHTIERNENYARPFLLSLDVIPRHMTQVIHDIAYREAVMDADRFLADSRVREAVEGVMGPEYYKQFRPWLQAMANDKVYDARGLAFWDKAAHWARTAATMVGLGYRLSTMMIHGSTAASNSVGEIGAKWMASGVRDVLGTPDKMAAARDFIFERSGEMRHRMNEVDRDVRDQLREMEAKSATGLTSRAADVVNGAKRGAFYGIAMLDFASAMPTWMGAYNRGLHEGLTEQQAVYAADKAVRNAHGGTGVKDLAAIQRGPEFQKLFTMFYSFWNHFYNRQRDIARTATAIPGKVAGGDYAGARRDFAMVLARSFFYFVIPQLLHAALKPPAPGQQDEEEGWVHWAAKEIALGMFSGVPVVRDVANAVSTGRDYQPTPAVAVVKAVGAEAKDIGGAVSGEGASDKWVKHAVQTAGYVFGLPTGQASNAVQYLWDVGDGKQDPQGLADWWHGLKDGHQ